MTDRPTIVWPSGSTRRTALIVAVVAAAGLFLVAAFMSGGADDLQGGVKMYRLFGDLTVARPAVGAGGGVGGNFLLVAFGDPRVFTVSVVVLTVLALRRKDRSLALFCSAGPVGAEIVAQLVGKPTFFALFGGHYGFPSGHTTGAVSLAIATTVLVARLAGPRPALLVSPLTGAVALLTTAGVVINHMHPLKDAYGGLLFTVAFMSLAFVACFRSGETKEPGQDHFGTSRASVQQGR